MNYLYSVLIGYLLGCLNPAYFIGKLKGFDIRTKGTHNAGASNTKVMLGWGWAAFVALFDISKSIIAFLITKALFNNFDLAVLAGASAVYGHIFPFYLGFKAGKGFAAYAGLTLIISPLWFAICVLVGAILTFSTQWIVCATLLFTITTPFWMYFGLKLSITACLFVAAASLIIIIKHIPNFKKLANHQEIGLNGNYVGTNIKADPNK